MLIIKCNNCNNEEQVQESSSESRRKECWNIQKFRIKIARHHELHIDCKNCGYKIKIYDEL